MTITNRVAPRDLHPRPRKAVLGPRPTRTPRPTRAGAVVLLVVLLLLCSGVLAAAVRADEGETERYVPSARGTRPAVTRWAPLVAQYDWPVDVALRIIDCESGGDPDAVNPYSGAAGLMQLYGWSRLARRLFGTGDVLLPEVNVGTAYYLWADAGGSFSWHWGSSAGCWR